MLVDHDGSCRLSDFGAALLPPIDKKHKHRQPAVAGQEGQAAAVNRHVLTASARMAKGTACWMAPEVIREQVQPGEWFMADIWCARWRRSGDWARAPRVGGHRQGRHRLEAAVVAGTSASTGGARAARATAAAAVRRCCNHFRRCCRCCTARTSPCAASRHSFAPARLPPLTPRPGRSAARSWR